MSHRCRSGKKCVARVSANEPALTVKPNTVCSPCVDELQRRRNELPHLKEALYTFRSRTPQAALQSRVSRSMSPQAPINVEVLALVDEAELLLQWLGNIPIRDYVKRPHAKFEVWIDGVKTEQYLDGCDIAIRISPLHSRMESLTGLAPKVEKRRYPCPRCELNSLCTVIGSGVITCSSSECGWCGSDDEYAKYGIFKAQKIRGVK